ncbi:hypothetical protein [Citrobacter koseri]|uniref:hypothetical protein n=1 Tax=Citrobacter koseri TaxID=545 RepID=UPI0028BE9A86|nr:hypothetical protein [Citrobacter koseri]MDT7487303.1 hypothetical protein [Citrobacter koseri]
MEGVSANNEVNTLLQTCLSENAFLKKISGDKYQNLDVSLMNALQASKSFYTYQNGINKNTNGIISSLYEYKIRSVCNNISQSMLSELVAQGGSTKE